MERASLRLFATPKENERIHPQYQSPPTHAAAPLPTLDVLLLGLQLH